MRKSKRNPATKKTWKQKDDEVGDPEVEGNAEVEVEMGAIKRKATSAIEKSLPRFKRRIGRGDQGMFIAASLSRTC